MHSSVVAVEPVVVEPVAVGLAAADLEVVEAEGWAEAVLAAVDRAGEGLVGVELAGAAGRNPARSIAPSIPGNPSATAALAPR